MAQLDETLVNLQPGHLDDHQQLHSKANYVFDVMDFGAKGDGTTDDTAAIQAAIDAAEAAGGGTVLVPPSTSDYVTVATLTIDGYGVNLHGTSRESTVIRNDTATTIQFGESALTWGFSVENITIQTAAAGAHAVEVGAAGMVQGVFTNVNFYATSATATTLYMGQTNANFLSCLFLGCMFWNTTSGTSVPLISITRNSATAAFNGNSFIGGWMQGATDATAPIVKLSTTVIQMMYGNTFQGIVFERATAGAIHADGNRSLHIRDCGVYDLTTATDSLFVLGKHADGNNCRHCSIVDTFRVGGDIDTYYDIEIRGGSATNIIINSGAFDPSSGKINLQSANNILINPAAATLDNLIKTILIDDRKLAIRGADLLAGTGTPEGAVTAPVGSTFMRTDGGVGTSFYVKETGSGNTGWVAK